MRSSKANTATPIARSDPLSAYMTTLIRLAPSSAAHDITAALAALVQNPSADSPFDRAGTRRFMTNEAAQAMSATARTMGTTAGGISLALANEGRSTKWLAVAKIRTPMTIAA